LTLEIIEGQAMVLRASHGYLEKLRNGIGVKIQPESRAGDMLVRIGYFIDDNAFHIAVAMGKAESGYRPFSIKGQHLRVEAHALFKDRALSRQDIQWRGIRVVQLEGGIAGEIGIGIEIGDISLGVVDLGYYTGIHSGSTQNRL